MRKLHDHNEAGLPAIASAAGRPAAEVLDAVREPDAPAPALRFDWMDWLPYLEDQDVSKEQKRELIETLWSIVVAFVDLGWRLNPKPEIGGEALDLKAVLTAVDHADGKEGE